MILTKEQILEIQEVEKAVCAFFEVDIDGIYEKTSKRKESLARSFLFYIAHIDMDISVGCIAKRYGRKPNAVFKSISKIKYNIEMTHTYKEMYFDIYNEKK